MKVNPKRFIAYFICLLIGIILGLLIINENGWNYFQNWRIENHGIILEYLKILLSFPSVLLVIIIFFSSKFSQAIDYFIRNMRLSYKGVEAFSQQFKNINPNDVHISEAQDAEEIRLSKQDAQEIADSIEHLQTQNKTKDQSIQELQGLVGQLANRSEFFEFRYLNTALVLNTKFALKNLFLTGQTTRDSFIINISIPSNLADKLTEQIAIHNALMVNGLVEEDGSLIRVSEKGERYLKFIGLIK